MCDWKNKSRDLSHRGSQSKRRFLQVDISPFRYVRKDRTMGLSKCKWLSEN
ncbi:hypothetical protein HMPREF3036_00343 [Sutterella sp. KLE1602]|nr:hypothetical protein HMPREF3036_00343 [Sutterella sp. KLE1602]